MPPSPSALRNREPIAAVLASILPATGTVLEIASGGGVHVTHFAERFPHLVFQPSEANPSALDEIDERARERAAGTILPALLLDVLTPWPALRADAVICINMIHASPPETLPALMRGASKVLPEGAPLVTYGPYRIADYLCESNLEFEASLKRDRDPRWGIRDLETVVAEAERYGFSLRERIAMPSNNFTLIFRRVAGD